MISRKSIGTLLAVCVFQWASNSWADLSLAVIPYAETGMSSYSLEFNAPPMFLPTEPAPTLVDLSSKTLFTFATLKLGTTLALNDFFVDAYYRTTNEASDTADAPFTGAPPIKWVAERNAVSLSAGYSFSNNLSASFGYRDSEAKGKGTLNSSTKFSHDGLFIGGNYSLELTDSGSLNFSLGYAWLDAEVDYRPYGFKQQGSDPDPGGDGSGVKVGIAWRDFLSENWGYSVGAEYYDYSYEFKSTSNGERSKVDMEESEISFLVGLFYVF